LKKKSLRRRIWERIHHALTHKEAHPVSTEEAARNLEVASELPRLKAPKFERWWMLGLSFRTWKIVIFGLGISFLNWVFWGLLDQMGAASGGLGGFTHSLNSLFQQIEGSLWNWSCVMPTPSEGPGACFFYLPNIVLLLIALIVVVVLLGAAIAGLVEAWKEDDAKKSQDQTNLIVAAVLAALEAEKAKEEAMRHNAEIREEEERLRKEEERRKGLRG
jgi:hypothetical protein